MATCLTLWSDILRKRHFLIPQGEKLPMGDFELRTLTGKKKFVNPSVLSQYEVTEEQAKEWLKSQFGQVLDSAKTSILDTIRSRVEVKPDLDAWFSRRESKPLYPESEPNPIPKSTPGAKAGTESTRQQGRKFSTDSLAISLLANLSGMSAEKLATDPEAARQALHTIFGQLGSFFKDATSGNEEQVQTAKQEMGNLRSTLQQYGLNVESVLDTIPDKIDKGFQTAKEELGADELARRVDALADDLEAALNGLIVWLRNQANELREEARTKIRPEHELKTTVPSKSD